CADDRFWGRYCFEQYAASVHYPMLLSEASRRRNVSRPRHSISSATSFEGTSTTKQVDCWPSILRQQNSGRVTQGPMVTNSSRQRLARIQTRKNADCISGLTARTSLANLRIAAVQPSTV